MDFIVSFHRLIFCFFTFHIRMLKDILHLVFWLGLWNHHWIQKQLFFDGRISLIDSSRLFVCFSQLTWTFCIYYKHLQMLVRNLLIQHKEINCSYNGNFFMLSSAFFEFLFVSCVGFFKELHNLLHLILNTVFSFFLKSPCESSLSFIEFKDSFPGSFESMSANCATLVDLCSWKL